MKQTYYFQKNIKIGAVIGNAWDLWLIHASYTSYER